MCKLLRKVKQECSLWLLQWVDQHVQQQRHGVFSFSWFNFVSGFSVLWIVVLKWFWDSFQVFNSRPIIDIKFANPNHIERALADVHKESVTKLPSMNLPHKQLQLLVIILPDEKGSYGELKQYWSFSPNFVHGGLVFLTRRSWFSWFFNHFYTGKIKRMCETELGLVSQCCQPRQAAKMQKQYCENVSLKINVKVGFCAYDCFHEITKYLN